MATQDNTAGTPSVDFRSLAADWRDWSRTVRLFAARRSRRHELDPGEYRVLHSELLRGLRTLVSSGEGDQRVYFEKLERTVQPWCNLDSFHGTDRDILFRLVAECKSAQRVLDGHIRPIWLSPQAVLLGGCAVLGVGVAAFLASGDVGGVAGGISTKFMSAVYWGGDVYRGLSQEERYIALGGLIAAVGTYVVVKSARKI